MGKHGFSVRWVCFSNVEKKACGEAAEAKIVHKIAMHKNGENGNRAQCV